LAPFKHNAGPTIPWQRNHLNTIEQYYIYAEFSKNNHLNDEHTTTPNKIFEVLLKPPPPPPYPTNLAPL